jgi:hypothetical protein
LADSDLACVDDCASAATEPGTPFLAHLHEIRDIALLGSDDIVGLVQPLLEQVVATHEQGLVAPLDGVDSLRVSMGHLWYLNSKATASRNNQRSVRQHDAQARSSGIEVTREMRVQNSDDQWSGPKVEDTRVAAREEAPRRAYFPDYIGWETRLDHHDALTDTFVLGLIMGSLATGLDLAEEDELQRFVAARSDLCSLNDRLSPVIAQLIERMTELSRSDRPQDLSSVAAALANYRYQELEDNIEAPPQAETGTRRQMLLNRLRNRLFEVSRRNRLLYYRETGSTANLTVGSVPHVLDVDSIRVQQLLFTNEDLCKSLGSDKPIRLDRWLRFEDYPFLGASLDRIRLQASRDVSEYGFSQLRLVTAFLRWHNLKDTANERINSPLILVPAQLKKRKGVRDSFELSVDAAGAEINPALRHHLGELYGIHLPETINAASLDEVRALTNSIRKQLTASEKGIELELVEAPRIQLIKRTAMRRLDRYRRKMKKTGRGLKNYSGLSYSYSGQRFEPLGVQIFARDIRPANAPSREMVETDSTPRVIEHMAKPSAGVSSVERDFYNIDSGAGKGSTQWEVDLCSVSLANFSYRKMTLVRDYTELADNESAPHANFEQLFSEDVRIGFDAFDFPATAQQYSVLPVDPSQQAAVLRARTEQSYVIQGPPGTGKSQTITNLIVDYVARGKSVLFVCEKRAALDVVYHRLQQVGLSDACCLIHDTREDKKPFIASLKQRYETAVANSPDSKLGKIRQDWLQRKQQVLEELDAFSVAMTEATDEGSQLPLRSIIGRWVESGAVHPDIDVRTRSQLPGWEAFAPAAEKTQRLRDTLERQGFKGILAASPVRFLRCDIGSQSDYLHFIETTAKRALDALTNAASAVDETARVLSNSAPVWSELLDATAAAQQLVPLAEAGSLSSLDANDPSARRAQKLLNKIDRLAATALQAQINAGGWNTEAELDEVSQRLESATLKEGKFLAFLNGDWRRAKAFVKANYSGDANSVTQALSLLHRRLTSSAKHEDGKEAFRAELKLSEDDSIDACRTLLDEAWNNRADLSPAQRDLLTLAGEHPNAGRTILQLSGNASVLGRADNELVSLLVDYQNETPARLQAVVQTLSENADACDDYVDDLAALTDLEPAVLTALRNVEQPFEALSIAVLDETIRTRLRKARKASRFDAQALQRALASLSALANEGRDLNGRWAMNVCAENFHAHLARASEPMSNTSQQEKDWRRAYLRGRKTLEREFEKTRAYRSVRELFASESGSVLRDLRPVWLMSPLSVADALPLAETLFDVVIFDEASQIPLEDAIPTINRAAQMIVVGDDMQLPPTRFFSGKANGSDEEEDDSLPDVVQFDLNADSFLTRASAALPSTMLAWHYRSKHESLIGFCNRAFYGGNLKTIPTPSGLVPRAPITIDNIEQVVINGDDLFDRPISHHRLTNSPYQSQRNAGEAQYIAHLVRHLLQDQREPTIGIVAFSQAQQSEIEAALQSLANDDSSFRNKLDLEEEREQDDQFVGLFVKNLENVQGDERDIIILSVCYAPNPSGRMIMNFGPINQNGGHKRLNVIFSRAKKNMVVVTSIAPQQITNTYNEGANALRQYLQYASAVSQGDTQSMLAALNEYGDSGGEFDTSTSAQILQRQVSDALTDKGFDVVSNYGQSDLRCHLAVRSKNDSTYRLAVLIDDASHYAITDIETRYTNSAAILRAFGWQVEYVLGKDWYQDKEATIDRLCTTLEN